MNLKSLIFLAVLTLIISSCNTRKAAKSTSPYLTEQESEPEIVVQKEKIKLVDDPNGTVHRYYVIIGSFKAIDNARQYRTDIINKGFAPVILENENGLYRISVGGYDDESAARTQISQIRKKFSDHSDVWLLVRK